MKATLEAGWAHGIALREDEDLGELLAELQLDEEIPDTLYRTVAEIIALLYLLKERYPQGYEVPRQS